MVSSIAGFTARGDYVLATDTQKSKGNGPVTHLSRIYQYAGKFRLELSISISADAEMESVVEVWRPQKPVKPQSGFAREVDRLKGLLLVELRRITKERDRRRAELIGDISK